MEIQTTVEYSISENDNTCGMSQVGIWGEKL